MNYKQSYLGLVEYMSDQGVFIYDTSIHGPGVSFNTSTPFKAICIDGRIGWKKRFFVLIHEIGHLFYYRDQYLYPRRSSGSEAQANKTAIKILNTITEDKKINREYAKYYNSLAKGSSHSLFILTN